VKRATLLLSAVQLALLLGPATSSAGAPEGKASSDFQPERRGDISPDRVVDIEHLQLDLLLDLDAGRVEGTVTHRVRPLRDGMRRLSFHQVGLDVTEVTVDGAAAGFSLNEDSIIVMLPEGMTREKAAQIAFTYSAQPDVGLHFRGPGKDSPDGYQEVWSQGESEDNRFWFPTFDFPRERFTYEGRFTAKSHLRVVSNGKLVGKQNAVGRSGYSTWHYSLGDDELVSYLVMVAAAEYQQWTDQWREVPLYYYGAGDADEGQIRRLLGRTGEMMEMFSRLTGADYPYEVYSQITVQRFIYTGMENSAATVLERDLLGPEKSAAFGLWGESVVAHELAHQWFGDLLTCRTWRHLWLNEGFATFFAGLWMAESKGPEYAARRLRQRYDGVMRSDKHGSFPLVRRFYNSEEGGRSANPYGKGASVLQMLRVMLGDDIFFRGIARYVATHSNRLVQTSDFQRAMEEESGMYLDWFFDQWAFLAGHPKLSVSHRHDPEAGTVRVTVKQSQEVGKLVPRFTLPVDIEIASEGGTRVERLWLDAGEESLQVEAAAPPLYVAVDPYGGLLARVESSQTAAQWAAQLSSEFPYAQETALHALKKLKGSSRDTVRSQVVELLGDAKSPLAHRIGASEVLAAWRSEADVEALLATLLVERTGSPLLRAELVDALGLVLPNEKVIKTLERVLGNDPLNHVRARALSSLANLEEERVRPRAIAALRGPASEDMVIQRAAAAALSRWGENSDLRALSSSRKADTDASLRSSAVWASVKIAGREKLGADRDAARAQIIPDAEQMLWDKYLRTRQSGVSVLSQIGDQGSVTALQALAAREDYQPLRKRVEEAIEAIRTRRDLEPDASEGEVKARMKKMEERLEGLEKSLNEVKERR